MPYIVGLVACLEKTAKTPDIGRDAFDVFSDRYSHNLGLCFF